MGSKTLVLPSGAKLAITVDVNLFDLAPDDRELVFGIVDQARRFIAEAEVAVGEHAARRDDVADMGGEAVT